MKKALVVLAALFAFGNSYAVLPETKVKLYGSDKEYFLVEEGLEEGPMCDYPWKRQVLMTEQRDTVAVFSGLRYEFVEIFPDEHPFLMIVNATGKGNGWHELYKMAGGRIERVYDGADDRTYDCHDDGDRFENCELVMKAGDYNGDGWNDIAFTGVRLTGEKYAVREAIEHIFYYDPRAGHFTGRTQKADS